MSGSSMNDVDLEANLNFTSFYLNYNPEFFYEFLIIFENYEAKYLIENSK
jgi:hypothetical protein